MTHRTIRRKSTISRIFLSVVYMTLSLSVSTAFGQRTDATSDNDDRLKQALERFPQADSNRDGKLTLREWQAFRPKWEALRKERLQQQQARQKELPKPTFANVKYGPHQRHVFDVWLPKNKIAEKPRPVFVYFHGGGFVAGDKSKFDPRQYLALGYAVMSSNYRFVDGENVVTPIPMQDCTRALQYLRYKAKDFGIDPTRVAISGGSAGAVITMWIAYKDDMADPNSDDPVARQSTRVRCIVPMAGPTNLDPAWITKNLGGPPEVHSSLPKFYGVQDGNYERPAIRKLIEESSAVTHATADDPPSLLIYSGRLDNLPLPADATQGLLIHHPYFGKVLKDKLDSLGVPCKFHYGGRTTVSIADFLKEHL